MTDKTLDEILKKRGIYKDNYDCVGWDGLQDSLKEAFEQGKLQGATDRMKAGSMSECDCLERGMQSFCCHEMEQYREKGAKDERLKLCKEVHCDCACFEVGKQTGRDEAIGNTMSCEKNEAHTVWKVGCYQCDQEQTEKIAALSEEKATDWGMKTMCEENTRLNQRIAALEAKVEIMKTKECPTCKRTRGTTAERLKCYCCLDDENARLREALVSCKKNDKTPPYRYENESKDGSRNSLGELPPKGAKWLTPKEIIEKVFEANP